MDVRNRGRDRSRSRNRVRNRGRNREGSARAMGGRATGDKSGCRHNLYRRTQPRQLGLRRSTGLDVDGPESELGPEPVLETLVSPGLDTVVALAPPQGASLVSEPGVPPEPELPVDRKSEFPSVDKLPVSRGITF